MLYSTLSVTENTMWDADIKKLENCVMRFYYQKKKKILVLIVSVYNSIV